MLPNRRRRFGEYSGEVVTETGTVAQITINGYLVSRWKAGFRTCFIRLFAATLGERGPVAWLDLADSSQRGIVYRVGDTAKAGGKSDEILFEDD